MRTRAADGARIRANGSEGKSDAVQNLAVGRIHLVVGDARSLRRAVKAVGILHDEFAGAHHAKARAALIAKLRADLIEIHRQLTPARKFIARQISDDFLARGLNHKVAGMAVLKAQKLGTVLGPAAGFLPELCGLNDGHRELNGAGGIHFLADDLFNFFLHAQTHRHDGVDACGKSFGKTGTNGQNLAGDFSVSRSFFKSGNIKLARAHG